MFSAAFAPVTAWFSTWTVGDWIQAAGVLAVLLVGWFLYRELRRTRLQTIEARSRPPAPEDLLTAEAVERRRARALECALSRHAHVMAARAAIDRAFPPVDWQARLVPREALVAAFSDDADLRRHFLTLFAHFDGLALAIDAGLADDDTAFELTGPVLVEYADRFEVFLVRERELGHLRQYVYMIRTAERWQKRLAASDNHTHFPTHGPPHARRFA